MISDEEDWAEYADEIVGAGDVKIMKRITPRGTAVEACVTRHGTVVAPIMTELVGFPDLTPYEGGWCGNEIFADAFNADLRDQAREATLAMGECLKAEGYRGYFELDFLIDRDTDKLYLGEMNPRITGASSITNHAAFALSDVPLFMFHLLEWMGVDHTLNVDEINRRWAAPEKIDSWGQLVLKHTADSVGVITQARPTGIWRMGDQGRISFSRYDTHCLWGVLDGINNAGLAVSLAFGGRRTTGDGFGVPLVLRYLLEVCDDVRQACLVLRRLSVHMTYNLTLVDHAGVFVTAYLTPDHKPRFVRSPVSTNHQDRIGWPAYARMSASVERRAFLEDRLADKHETRNSFIDRFLQPPIYRTRYERAFGTLYTAIYDPTEASAEYRWPGQAALHQSFASFEEGQEIVRLGQSTAEKPAV